MSETGADIFRPWFLFQPKAFSSTEFISVSLEIPVLFPLTHGCSVSEKNIIAPIIYVRNVNLSSLSLTPSLRCRLSLASSRSVRCSGYQWMESSHDCFSISVGITGTPSVVTSLWLTLMKTLTVYVAKALYTANGFVCFTVPD